MLIRSDTSFQVEKLELPYFDTPTIRLRNGLRVMGLYANPALPNHIWKSFPKLDNIVIGGDFNAHSHTLGLLEGQVQNTKGRDLDNFMEANPHLDGFGPSKASYVSGSHRSIIDGFISYQHLGPLFQSSFIGTQHQFVSTSLHCAGVPWKKPTTAPTIVCKSVNYNRVVADLKSDPELDALTCVKFWEKAHELVSKYTTISHR